MVSEWLRIGGAVALPHIGGLFGAFVVAGPNKEKWYNRELKKPSFSPPNWVFGPVWTALYSGMGYASYLVWKNGGGFQGELARPALLAYGTQLALNWAWTPLFFGAKKIKLAFFELILTTGTVGLTAVLFYRVNHTAGLLLAPYFLWCSFASLLSYNIWQLNKDKSE